MRDVSTTHQVAKSRPPHASQLEKCVTFLKSSDFHLNLHEIFLTKFVKLKTNCSKSEQKVGEIVFEGPVLAYLSMFQSA